MRPDGAGAAPPVLGHQQSRLNLIPPRVQQSSSHPELRPAVRHLRLVSTEPGSSQYSSVANYLIQYDILKAILVFVRQEEAIVAEPAQCPGRRCWEHGHSTTIAPENGQVPVGPSPLHDVNDHVTHIRHTQIHDRGVNPWDELLIDHFLIQFSQHTSRTTESVIDSTVPSRAGNRAGRQREPPVEHRITVHRNHDDLKPIAPIYKSQWDRLSSEFPVGGKREPRHVTKGHEDRYGSPLCSSSQ